MQCAKSLHRCCSYCVVRFLGGMIVLSSLTFCTVSVRAADSSSLSDFPTSFFDQNNSNWNKLNKKSIIQESQIKDPIVFVPNSAPDRDLRHAVVFWNGVNGCKPTSTPEYRYTWQENADNLRSSLENYSSEFAQPFGIMARANDPIHKVITEFDTYLVNCKKEGKVPYIVLSPDLNIEGYVSTLIPNKLIPMTFHGEITVRKDIQWTRTVTPIILSKLAENGYAIDGYAHSFGGTMVVEGIQAGHTSIRSLTTMNARAQNSSFDTLQKKGLVDNVWRITTIGDALTYPGKASFGKGDILIWLAEIDGWKSSNPLQAMEIHHNVVLLPGSTQIGVEIRGQKISTDLRTLLRHEVFTTQAKPTELVIPRPQKTEERGGVLLRSDVLSNAPPNLNYIFSTEQIQNTSK